MAITTSGINVPGSAPGGSTMDYISGLTRPGGMPRTGGNATVAASERPGGIIPSTGSKSAAYWLIGLIFILAAAKLALENKKGEKLEMHHVRISVLNWLLITVLAVTGIASAKAIFMMNPKLRNSGLGKVIFAA